MSGEPLVGGVPAQEPRSFHGVIVGSVLGQAVEWQTDPALARSSVGDLDAGRPREAADGTDWVALPW